jgi:hypothetical protein
MTNETQKVFKLVGESYEVNEEPIVYASEELAKKGMEGWVGFHGMSVEEMLNQGEIVIEEYELIK